ncbi:MAG: ComF family protein [Ruminococcaceae bacterium]|nr:ComF family protein [Oscillospiraceae bacterium]
MNLIKYILDLVFPPICISCNKVLYIDEKLPFCKECYKEIVEAKRDAIKDLGNRNVDKCYFLYSYKNEKVQQMVFHAKNVFSKKFAEYFRKEIEASLKEHNLIDKLDLIVFVPRDRSGKRKYGFDQAEELAKETSSATGIPYESIIKRVGKAKKQKFLKAEERIENVKNKFTTKGNVIDKSILVVDDVVTTGATVCEIARILKENGAKSIYVFTLAG